MYAYSGEYMGGYTGVYIPVQGSIVYLPIDMDDTVIG
tara:strand:- start:148 stop:258 length:111 start_codon:yes stop_codon:yes gene_type:complete